MIKAKYISIMKFHQWIRDAEENRKRRKEEIQLYISHLEDFGLSFEDLSWKNSPKHADARKELLWSLKLLMEDDELKEILFAKKRLPVKQLEGKVEVSRKTIERNRKYIIAVAIINKRRFFVFEWLYKRAIDEWKKELFFQLHKRFVTLLTPEGEFLKTKRQVEREYEVGEEITFSPAKTKFTLAFSNIHSSFKKTAVLSIASTFPILFSILPFLFLWSCVGIYDDRLWIQALNWVWRWFRSS